MAARTMMITSVSLKSLNIRNRNHNIPSSPKIFSKPLNYNVCLA